MYAKKPIVHNIVLPAEPKQQNQNTGYSNFKTVKCKYFEIGEFIRLLQER